LAKFDIVPIVERNFVLTLTEEEAKEVRRLYGKSTGGPSTEKLFSGSRQPSADLKFWNKAREVFLPIYDALIDEEE
jgi:hypothetical protein